MPVSLKGNTLRIGAAASLQDLLAAEGLPAAIVEAIRREPADAQAAVVAHLLAADGRSPLAAAMLALDTEFEFADGISLAYGSLLALRALAPSEPVAARVTISTQLDCYYEADAWLALARWPSGRTRLALGGWGAAPVLAMDGREPSGIREAAENALSGAGEAQQAVVRRLVEQVVRD